MLTYNCTCYIINLQITDNEKILINGEESLEFTVYFTAFLLRLYGDSYKEHYSNIIKAKLSNAIVYAPFGLPEGFPLEEVKQMASEEAFKKMYPELKAKLDISEEKSKSIWPNIPSKDNPLIRKKTEN